MSRFNDMTMSEIVAEAINRGFDPKPWNGKLCHWNNGVEVNAIAYLEQNGGDLFEETEED
jgi:hypothetical protein